MNRILRSSIVDGPGSRAAVFVQGCNYDCVYCHNPETISLCNACGLCVRACPAGALLIEAADPPGGPASQIRWRGEKCVFCDACITACPRCSSPRTRLMSPEDVMSEIEPSLAFIRGVTVSGGECTLYPDFLRALGGLVKERSLSFFLDSNGSYDYAGDPALMAVTDGVMLDVKADPDASEYRRITGRNGPGLLKQLDFLAGAGKLWEARTVVSPGLLDAPALVDMVCRRLAGTAGPPRYKLIRYRPAGVRRAAAEVLTEPGEGLMERLAAICTKHGIKAEAV